VVIEAQTNIPNSPAELADMLRRASDARTSVVIRGAGTKSDWGRPPVRIDAVLSTRGLNRVLAHEHGDLTATIEAGATLREVNVALSKQQQWLPLDPSFAGDATIGGILATNDSGPLRHRFGTPRDLVIGTHVASADGLLAKSGGQVVKNVAGYDLSKLLAGSFGSLAAIVSATFKLSPLPAMSRTLIVRAPGADDLHRLVREVLASQLEPIAFEIQVSMNAQPVPPPGGSDSLSLALRFASVPAAVDAQFATALALTALKSVTTATLEGDNEAAFWRDHNARPWATPGAVVRASWLPANVDALIAELKAGATPMHLIGRAGVGAGLIRIDGDVRAQADAIAHLRASPMLGNVIVLRAAPELKALVDVWGSHGDREPLFASLKRAFDPQGILNAGRGPL
jgi:glycolate oxidase FAD binding subunit